MPMYVRLYDTLLIFYGAGQLESEVSAKTQKLNARDAELAAAKQEVIATICHFLHIQLNCWLKVLVDI